MTAIYKQVSEDILAQILNGDLKVGDKLPPEAQYAEELGISRSTLRLALAELERHGVLQRRKRFGTQIVSSRPKSRFSMDTSSINELLTLGRDMELTITGTRTVPTQAIPQLEGYHSETGHWLEVSGTRTLPEETTPFSYNRVYVPARYAGIEPLLKRKEISVFCAIEDNFGIAVGRVSQTVKAIACPAEEAKFLGLEVSAPVLRIEAQLYQRDNTLMEISVSTFVPEKFQVHADVTID